jgi:hypothetical protein
MPSFVGGSYRRLGHPAEIGPLCSTCPLFFSVASCLESAESDSDTASRMKAKSHHSASHSTAIITNRVGSSRRSSPGGDEQATLLGHKGQHGLRRWPGPRRGRLHRTGANVGSRAARPSLRDPARGAWPNSVAGQEIFEPDQVVTTEPRPCRTRPGPPRPVRVLRAASDLGQRAGIVRFRYTGSATAYAGGSEGERREPGGEGLPPGRAFPVARLRRFLICRKCDGAASAAPRTPTPAPLAGWSRRRSSRG